jgi:hypothetical protein
MRIITIVAFLFVPHLIFGQYNQIITVDELISNGPRKVEFDPHIVYDSCLVSNSFNFTLLKPTNNHLSKSKYYIYFEEGLISRIDWLLDTSISESPNRRAYIFYQDTIVVYLTLRLDEFGQWVYTPHIGFTRLDDKYSILVGFHQDDAFKRFDTTINIFFDNNRDLAKWKTSVFVLDSVLQPVVRCQFYGKILISYSFCIVSDSNVVEFLFAALPSPDVFVFGALHDGHSLRTLRINNLFKLTSYPMTGPTFLTTISFQSEDGFLWEYYRTLEPTKAERDQLMNSRMPIRTNEYNR